MPYSVNGCAVGLVSDCGWKSFIHSIGNCRIYSMDVLFLILSLVVDQLFNGCAVDLVWDCG